MQGKQLRAAILLALDRRHRDDPSRTVDDTELAEELGAPIEDIRRQLDILEEQGLSKAANTFGGHSAYVSPKGMAVAEELREGSEGEEAPGRPIGFD